MKRSRVPISSEAEAALARARPCPVSPDALLALLNNADMTARLICASTTALASLTADLVARNKESLKLAVVQVASSRSSFRLHNRHVFGLAKRLFRKQCKRFEAALETVDVSRKQLRVWTAVAGTAFQGFVGALDCAFSTFPLLAPSFLAQDPAIRISGGIILLFRGELGRVATGDELRVISAAGPGRKGFKPLARNEFSVVLAQADGSVPVWLTSGDVVVDVLTPDGIATAGTAWSTAAVARSDSMGQPSCTVRVVYEGLSESTVKAVLRMKAFGTPVAGATGDSNWCVRVPRRPLAVHECAAVGTYVKSLAVGLGCKYGMVVSADEQWLVVGLGYEGTLSVYSLPGGELVRTFGGRGDGPLQFKGLSRMCIAPNGNLILADQHNMRLQEVTLEGVFVRFMGVDEFAHRYSYPNGVDVQNDLIAVVCQQGAGPRVVLFDVGSGAVKSRFGEVGVVPGRLSVTCTGIRFVPDGSHVIVAEDGVKRLSVFTTTGVFVRCVGVGKLGGGMMDVTQSVTGEYVVADQRKQRVSVFSADGSALTRSWDVRGTGESFIRRPSALAAAGQHLYVLESDSYFGSGQVLVFE